MKKYDPVALAEAILRSIGRDKEIIKLRKEGLTYQKIADIFGISRQRVEQIVKRIERNGKSTD